MKISISGINKSFGKDNILNNVTIDASAGECVGILGVNGSGKSTLFNILAGITKCDAGTAVLDGKDIFSDKKTRREMIGYITQNPPLIEELTAYDNLLLWYDKKTMKEQLYKNDGVLKMLGVDKFLKVRVSRMSGGMKKRLAIGCAVAHNPKILLLDEPTGALDLVCKESITKYLSDFKKSGGIILIATHDIQDIPLCDKMYIIKKGVSQEYTFDGSISSLTGNLL